MKLAYPPRLEPGSQVPITEEMDTILMNSKTKLKSKWRKKPVWDQVKLECCRTSGIFNYIGSAQKLLGILSAKCPVLLGLLQTDYAK
jgi:hypothetical protein